MEDDAKLGLGLGLGDIVGLVVALLESPLIPDDVNVMAVAVVDGRFLRGGGVGGVNCCSIPTSRLR